MDVYIVCLLFVSKQISAVTFNENHIEEKFPFQFVAAIVEKSTQQFVALGVVLSPHWVVSVAHAFPPDSDGLPYENYSIITGRPWRVYNPTFGLTHPAYTWGLYTAEDFALFYVPEEIATRPVFISAGRFPWNSVDCDFIYWDESQTRGRRPYEGLLQSFKSEVTVVQNCLTTKQRRPIGLLQFYLNDILCAKSGAEHPPVCVGKHGGVLYCQNLFVGMLVRHDWCQGRTANFTDVGTYMNWLQSRVTDGVFIRLYTARASTRVPPYQAVFTLAVACFFLGIFLS